MRRSDQPRRPSARTCCCLSRSKTLLMPSEEHAFPAARQRLGRYLEMAGFQVSINGRFWVSTEALASFVKASRLGIENPQIKSRQHQAIEIAGISNDSAC